MARCVKWWTHWIDQIGIVTKYGVILMAYISGVCKNIIVELLKKENLMDCIIVLLLCLVLLTPFSSTHSHSFCHLASLSIFHSPFDMEPYSQSYLSTDVNDSTSLSLHIYPLFTLPSHIEIPLEQPQISLSRILAPPQSIPGIRNHLMLWFPQ